MSFEERMDPLNKLFLMISMFSPVVVGIATSFGLDPRFLWFPMLVFLSWSIYIYWYRGVYQLREEKERSLVERIRGISYVFCFVATFVLNGFLILYIESDLENTPIVGIAVIVVTSLLLIIITIGIPKTFFLKQTTLFNKSQMESLHRILKEVGVASIYVSFLIFFNNVTIVLKSFFPFDILLTLLMSGFFCAKIYFAERNSRMTSQELSLSLKKTRWLRMFLSSKKSKKRQKT